MKIFKIKALWYALYGVIITMIFLYLLFPSDIARNFLENAVNSPGLVLKMDSVKPSLPCGLKMKKVSFISGPAANPYFQGDVLDVQLNPLNYFQKIKTVKLSGKAYGGKFSGRFKTASSRIYPFREGNLKFENIDLGKYAFLKTLLGKELTGKAKGSWTHTSRNPGGGDISGTIALSLNGGTYPLAEPFLGLNRIDYDRGDIQARLENGTLRMEKFQISGRQIDCFLNGDIILADEFKNSQINLKGEMVISDRKVKMNITIEGTLANPVLRYI